MDNKSNRVDQFYKNSGEQKKYVISINHFQGNQYLDMRLFFKPDGEEDFLPSRKGLSISIDHAGRLQKAIEKAIKQVQGA